MTKKLLLAALAGSVVQFFCGWLIYGILLAGFMEAQTIHYDGLMKEMSGSFLPLIFLSGFTMSFLISFIFQRWAKFETFAKGMTAGMLIGFCMSLSWDLSSYSMMNLITVNAIVVDVIVATILNGLVGGVIGFVLGTGKSAAPTAGS